jgi:hypothetical protein
MLSRVEPAWRDASTRRAIRNLGLRSATVALLGVAVLLATGFLFDDSGDPKYGIPVFVAVGIISVGGFLLVLGICFLVVVVRMRIILGRYPWVTLPAHFKSMVAFRYRRPARIAIVTLGNYRHGERRHASKFELSTLGLTWKSLPHEPTLRVCAPPSGGSGVVATVDYRIIAWARPANPDEE